MVEQAQLSLPFGDSLDRILRYQTAFHRQFLSYIKTLAQLQEARRKKEGTK